MVKLTYVKVTVMSLLLCPLLSLTGTGVCGLNSESLQPIPLQHPAIHQTTPNGAGTDSTVLDRWALDI